MQFFQRFSETREETWTFTPEMAKELMDNNAVRFGELGLVPRPVKKSRVTQYSSAMARGLWLPKISAIHIASNGAILNGQHRLLACILSGVPFQCVVVFNTPPEWYTKFDTGHRTHYDGLVIANEPNAKMLASLLPLIAAYFDGKVGTYRVDEYSPEDTKRLAEENRDELDEAISFADKADYKATFVAFMYFILNRQNYLSETIEFLSQFKDGANMPHGCPAWKLRNRIVKYGRNIRNKELLAKLFYIVNRIIQGERVTTLKSDWTYALSDVKKTARRKK